MFRKLGLGVWTGEPKIWIRKGWEGKRQITSITLIFEINLQTNGKELTVSWLVSTETPLFIWDIRHTWILGLGSTGARCCPVRSSTCFFFQNKILCVFVSPQKMTCPKTISSNFMTHFLENNHPTWSAHYTGCSIGILISCKNYNPHITG